MSKKVSKSQDPLGGSAFRCLLLSLSIPPVLGSGNLRAVGKAWLAITGQGEVSQEMPEVVSKGIGKSGHTAGLRKGPLD